VVAIRVPDLQLVGDGARAASPAPGADEEERASSYPRAVLVVGRPASLGRTVSTAGDTYRQTVAAIEKASPQQPPWAPGARVT
jgi:hypothetical protein